MKKETGFTLIELLIGIAVLAVLLGIGVPSFQETIRTNRVAAITNDMVAAMQFARSEAVRRGQQAEVCPPNDPLNPTACGADWNNGWIVVSGGAVIRVWPQLRAGANVAPVVAGNIEFRPMGQVVVDRCFNVTFDGAARNVDVAPGGRVRAAAGAC